MIKKYEKYLEIIGDSLNRFFEQQRPYIFCKEGCSICCETGTYPFSKIEFEYLMIGYEKLSDNQKEQVKKNIKHIKKEKKKSGQENFLHACPFLLNKKCSIYNHRGIICRTYGLMSYYSTETEEEYKIPCCVDNGLNYSNVYDKELKTVTSQSWKESGIEIEPVSYNVDLKFLLNNNTTKELSIDFGQPKGIIDWFN